MIDISHFLISDILLNESVAWPSLLASVRPERLRGARYLSLLLRHRQRHLLGQSIHLLCTSLKLSTRKNHVP